MRRYIIDNALMWLRDFHVDGLRLDAVHALVDERATHVLEELAQEVDALSVAVGRPLSLIAESDLNDPRMVTPRAAGGLGMTAQWSDDFHHALHATLTGEGQGYYADFARGRRSSGVAKTLTGAFFHDGTWSELPRAGTTAGRSNRAAARLERFLGYLQDHDQIGNRAVGDRISATLSPGLLAVGAALVLTTPVHADAVHGRGVGRGHARGSSSPTTPSPSWARPTAEGRQRRVRRARLGPPATSPTRRTRRPSPAPSSTGPSPPGSRTAAMLAVHRALLALRRAHPDLRRSRPQPDGGQLGRRRPLAGRAPRLAAGGGQPGGRAAGVDLDVAATDVLFATGELPVLDGETVTLPAESAAVVATS